MIISCRKPCLNETIVLRRRQAWGGKAAMGSGASAASALLSVNNLEVVYDDVMLVLRGVSLTVPTARSSRCSAPTARARPRCCGRCRACSSVHDGEITKGSVVFDGKPVQHEPPTEIVSLGINQVMEGRRIFAELTVEENLRLGGHTGTASSYPRISSGSTACSRCSRSGASAPPDTCPAASSRCWRSAGR